jgi:hypothetical protein
VRADTTVIPANVATPTDSGLLARAVSKLVCTARRVQAAGGATGTLMTDRRRAAARRVREIASKPRRREKLSQEESTRVGPERLRSGRCVAAATSVDRPHFLRISPSLLIRCP